MNDDLENLGDKIALAQEKQHEQENSESGPKKNPGMRAGSDFLAHVIAGTILGYVIDRFFGTLPWGLIVFCIAGFAAGVFSANRSMNKK
jgi:ATP synthase protein I